jgi:diaminopimelate decarboxylase
VTGFEYRNAELHVESLPLTELARRFGTPCYIYSKAALSAAYRDYQQAFAGHDHLICYAVKANSNLAILNLFARLGSGFDIVSGGELERVLAAGAAPAKIVFSGVGKSAAEIRRALECDILCFNVESESELLRIAGIAASTGRTARISLRVNPDVDAGTHPYIATGLRESKFGVAFEDALPLYRRASALRGIEVVGIDCHIGSQIMDTAPFVAAVERMLSLVDQLAAEGIVISHIDAGGGLGIRSSAEDHPPAVAAYAQALLRALGGRPQKILLEPGRSLAGGAGILLTRIEYLKHNRARNFAVVDAAMNDLLRPALYDAYHDILPVLSSSSGSERYEIVGPVCETGDFLGRARSLAVAEGDLLAVMSAGAYGMSMSSNYNTRPRAAEVIVDDTQAHLVRERESIAQLYSQEKLLP